MMALRRHYPSVAWDFPGYDQSEPLPIEAPRLAHYAVVLNHLIEHLEIKRFVLVGHSLGCLVAARYARATPEGIAALFLISPALGYGEKKDAPLPPELAARITEFTRLGAAKFVAKRAPALLADPSARPDILQAVERAMATVRRPGYDHAARVLANGRLESDAQHIELPAAVIMGNKVTSWSLGVGISPMRPCKARPLGMPFTLSVMPVMPCARRRRRRSRKRSSNSSRPR
jgi:pimeloyl-ACP methyl ester carboxylesterase